MPYYSELSKIVDNIIGEKILRNQNICKLLYYYPESGSDNMNDFPDLNYSVYSQPDIKNTDVLFYKNVFPLPKIPEAETKQQTFILVNLSGGYDVDENTGFRRVNILIDIISHLKCWKVKEGYRPYLIMSEIDKILNSKITDLPITGAPYSRGFQPRDYSNYFYGLQMIYEVSVNSNIDCGGLPKNQDINSKLVYPVEETSKNAVEIPKISYLPRNFHSNNQK